MLSNYPLVRGISWMGVLRFATRSLAILKFIVLARVLLPDQFGRYGVALLVLGFTEILTETGINIFLIQQKENWEKYLGTAWVISIVKGFAIFGFIFVFAQTFSNLFANVDATRLIQIAGTIALVRGFINPAVVKFQKSLDFAKEFRFRFLLYFVDFIVAVILGFITKLEYSLIVAMIASALMEVFVSLLLIKPRPVLNFKLSFAREIVKSGKWLTASGIFEYLFSHLDDILVGKMLGVYSLGLYQQAYRISTLPISEVGEVFNKVSLPVYAQLHSNKTELKKAFLKTTFFISLLVIPFGLLLIIFPEIIVKTLLGEAWIEAIPTIRVLAVFGILKSISNSSFSLFLALKKQHFVTAITLVGIIGLGVSLVPLISAFEIVGAAYATIIGVVIGLPYVAYFLLRVFKSR